jgi:predicted metal-binding membrane protein
MDILRRDRAVLAGSLLLITLLAWAYTAREARSMADLCVHMNGPRTAADVGMTLLMWIIMMVAMMTPSAAPMVLVFAAVSEKRRRECRAYVPSIIFLSGYLSVWAAFSVAATAAQWALHSVALLSPMMVSTSPYLGASLLVCAAVFQWTQLKRACLAHCRSPLAFLLAYCRAGARGAFLMGLHHGAYCVGCCWALMALLFVAGVMNLLWVGLLSIFVLAEKILPRGEVISRSVSAVLLVIAFAILKRAW